MTKRYRSVQDILRAASVATGLTRERILSPGREKVCAHARAAIARVAIQRGFTSCHIGRVIRRDHSSVHGLIYRFRRDTTELEAQIEAVLAQPTYFERCLAETVVLFGAPAAELEPNRLRINSHFGGRA